MQVPIEDSFEDCEDGGVGSCRGIALMNDGGVGDLESSRNGEEVAEQLREVDVVSMARSGSHLYKRMARLLSEYDCRLFLSPLRIGAVARILREN